MVCRSSRGKRVSLIRPWAFMKAVVLFFVGSDFQKETNKNPMYMMCIYSCSVGYVLRGQVNHVDDVDWRANPVRVREHISSTLTHQ